MHQPPAEEMDEKDCWKSARSNLLNLNVLCLIEATSARVLRLPGMQTLSAGELRKDFGDAAFDRSIYAAAFES